MMAIVEGNWGFGQVTMSRAAELGLDKARQTGMAAVAVRQANHIGRLGSYVDLIARKGMIGLMFVNAAGVPQLRMAPWGGDRAEAPHRSPRLRDSRFHGADRDRHDHHRGRRRQVRVARNRGVETPDGWLLNSRGEPTNDPNDLYGDPPGSILPLGGAAAGHKGYALNVALELIGGILTGSGYAGKDRRIRNGVLLIVIDVEQFLPLDEFFGESEKFVAHVKSSPPAEGFDEILMPGEIETRAARQRAHGIAVEEETWRQIVDWGAKLGIALESGSLPR